MNQSPDDITYVVGTTGNQLIWVFEAHESQDEPAKYSVTVDETPLEGQILVAWQDNVNIVVKVDGFNTGVHNVMITVNDTGTDTGLAPPAMDTAVVTVIDATNSNVISTPSSSVEENTSSQDNADFPVWGLVSVAIPIILVRKAH